MGRRHKGRPIDGVFLLDKPPGSSSNYVLQRIKRSFGAAKAGHTGALDPLATGMLPLTFGEATKFSQFLLDADKRYQTTVKLGIRTDSSDADGEIVEQKPVSSDINEALIAKLLVEHFTGLIEQVPSMFSALKHNGQPLYKLARKGEKVEVKPRQVTIHKIELLAFRPEENEFDLDVRCSKGTYIRSIAEDLGMLLGCGGHVKVLRRLESGPYKAESMISMEQFEALLTNLENEPDEVRYKTLDTLLIPSYSPVEHLPKLSLTDKQKEQMFQGKPITIEQPEDLYRLHVQSDDQFIGIGVVDDNNTLRSKRLLNTTA